MAEIRAKEFARGMHSLIGSDIKIIIKGVMMPPPPIPPALASMFIIAIIIIPDHSKALRGNVKSLKLSISEVEGTVEFVFKPELAVN